MVSYCLDFAYYLAHNKSGILCYAFQKSSIFSCYEVSVSGKSWRFTLEAVFFIIFVSLQRFYFCKPIISLKVEWHELHLLPVIVLNIIYCPDIKYLSFCWKLIYFVFNYLNVLCRMWRCTITKIYKSCIEQYPLTTWLRKKYENLWDLFKISNLCKPDSQRKRRYRDL